MSQLYKNIKTTLKNRQSLGEPVNLLEAQNNIYFQEALKKALAFYYWMNINYEKGIK
jgi:hypothetical protein